MTSISLPYPATETPSWKTYVNDAAGGLTDVSEPDPNNATPSSSPVTYYWLNGAGQIVYVAVERGSVS